MALRAPNLDDRSFADLLDEAKRLIAERCPTWTDHSPSDPGMVLLEAFAHLTEVMIYRLNRLPEKAYIELLRLIGTKLIAPGAARTPLRFTASRVSDRPIAIPRGTRVTVERSSGGAEPVVFATVRAATIPAGDAEVEVLGYHCQAVEAELAGLGTGSPGQWVRAARAPIVAAGDDDLELVVAVEATSQELAGRARALEHGGKAYRVWREVESFTDVGPDGFVYVVDRTTGTISFGATVRLRSDSGALAETPQKLGEAPPAGREIRLWYYCGGGAVGNVAANALRKLKDPIAGITVTNPEPATGGSDAETLENALRRGPRELHALQRAVTASDFEYLAQTSSPAVGRAKAFTRAALWRHAVPGAVEVLLVPSVPVEAGGSAQVTAPALKERETGETLAQIQSALDERKPLGTSCGVGWVRYKTVQVKARIVVHRGESGAAVRTRVLERLHEKINPLPTRANEAGWQFGRALRVSDVYDVALSEPGVSYVDAVKLVVDDVPDRDVFALIADVFQPRTWHCTAGPRVYRSLDDGEGWEVALELSGETADVLKGHRSRPGLLALCAQLGGGGKGSKVYVSEDCGETWRFLAQLAFEIHDLDWMDRDGAAVLIVAADKGLYEIVLRDQTTPLQIVVDPADQDLGFYALATSVDARGNVYVAVAGRSTRGVFLSRANGRSGTFEKIGLEGENVQVLEVQEAGPRAFLWAGVYAAADEPGKGCCRWELRPDTPPEGWTKYPWEVGSCRSIGFRDSLVIAGSHRGGMMMLDTAAATPKWTGSSVDSGLPLRDAGRFHPVASVACDRAGQFILVGGAGGIHRTTSGATFELASRREFEDRVTIPTTWVMCSGAHEVEVESEDETRGD